MKAVLFPADAYACGHYRLVWPANVLQEQGWDIHIVPPNGQTGFLVKTEEQPDGSQRLIELTAPQCDLIVLQRPSHFLQPQLVPALRKAGIAVVVDMDDDMSALSPNNVAFNLYRDRTKTGYSWRTASEVCKLATMVTTSTAALQKVYAKHGRGRVLDNFVPEAVLAYPEPVQEGFGWAGTVGSHPDDLQVTQGAVQRLIEEGHDFTIVGDGKDVQRPLKLREQPPATGGVGLDKWISTIAATYQVGMVPLASTHFNTSKSRLKGIENMAAGAPWVASPRAEYRRLQKESGCGFLADNGKEWYAHLKRLLTDDVLRKEQAQMGKEYMATQTYQANAWRWAEAWTDAVAMQRG